MALYDFLIPVLLIAVYPYMKKCSPPPLFVCVYLILPMVDVIDCEFVGYFVVFLIFGAKPGPCSRAVYSFVILIQENFETYETQLACMDLGDDGNIDRAGEVAGLVRSPVRSIEVEILWPPMSEPRPDNAHSKPTSTRSPHNTVINSTKNSH